MNYLRRYRSNALTTTAVTVVPSAAAFSTAAFQIGSGMRSERGMVATSTSDRLVPGNVLVPVGDVRGVILPGRILWPVGDERPTRAARSASVDVAVGVAGLLGLHLLSHDGRRVSTVCTLPVSTVKGFK